MISFFTAAAHTQRVMRSGKYCIIPRWHFYELYIRLSLAVSWQFVNLDYAFNNVSDHSSRPLYMYSDLGTSSVLGDQITDFIRAIDFRCEGRGS